MPVTINSYADVQRVLTAFVNAAGVTPGLAPHHVFWNSLNYSQFTTGNVPGISPPLKILVVGNSKSSNIILALQGAANSPFAPTGRFRRMPRPNPPYNSSTPTQDDVTAALALWIDKGCKNAASAGSGKSGKAKPAPKGKGAGTAPRA